MLKTGEITNILPDGKFEVLCYASYDHSQHALFCTKHFPPLNVKYVAMARVHNYEYNIGDKVILDISDHVCQYEKLLPIIQYKLVK